jgi:hypothetical protein
MSFDLDKTLYFFTAGRYEFHNKGGDLFIEAMARLNHMLKVAYPTIYTYLRTINNKWGNLTLKNYLIFEI